VEIIEEKTLQVQRTEASLEDVLSDGWWTEISTNLFMYRFE
jgi:hypothetical protein